MKHIHFIGIKGVGVAALAVIAKEAGFIVSGCDTNESFITDSTLQKAGIVPVVGFDPSHIEGMDMVITTGAHGGFSNPEVQAAQERGIPLLTQGQAVGEFMKGTILHRSFTGISIAGCHGKTTTTAMVATMLKSAGKDPSFVIGTGDIPSLGAAGHLGQGTYFIAEADEYATEPVVDKTAKFLWQYPTIAVITNIEFDHPDIYPSLDAVRQAYATFLTHIPDDGTLIINGDDEQCRTILEKYTKKYITFGFNSSNQYVLSDVQATSEGTTFYLTHQGVSQQISVPTLGEHNALNATAALLIGKELGLSSEDIIKGLAAFKGTKRRLEFIGTLASETLLYDDYAHHPTEIIKSLAALNAKYPDKKITCIFQPHTFSRTKILFDQFIDSFKDADAVIVTDIFASKREAPTNEVSSEKLVAGIAAYHPSVQYISTISAVIKYLHEQTYTANDVIVTMGAGDIYKVIEALDSKQ